MAADTGLTTKQITTWLLNARKRLLPRLRIKHGLDREDDAERGKAPRKRERPDDDEYTERDRSSRSSRSRRSVQ